MRGILVSRPCEVRILCRNCSASSDRARRAGSNGADRRWQRHLNFPHLTKVSLGAQLVTWCAWNPPGLTIFELHLLGLAAGSGVVTHQTGLIGLLSQ